MGSRGPEGCGGEIRDGEGGDGAGAFLARRAAELSTEVWAPEPPQSRGRRPTIVLQELRTHWPMQSSARGLRCAAAIAREPAWTGAP